MNKIYFLLLFILTSASATAGNTDNDTSKVIMKRPVAKQRIIQEAPTENAGKGCDKIYAVDLIIGHAISIGAAVYNDGNHEACFLIYEGAANKILLNYGSKCKIVKKLLEDALDKISLSNYSPADNAWILRIAFDQILGEPTTTTTK